MHRSFLGLRACALLAAAACTVALSTPALAQGVNASVTAELQGGYTGINSLGSVGLTFDQKAVLKLTPGAGAGKADKIYTATRTLAASGVEDLDLAGTLTDPLGQTLTFVKIKAIYIKAAATNTNNVVVGGASTNGFIGPFGAATHTLAVRPGDFVLLADVNGWTVTPSTADLLHIANSAAGTGVTYDVIIVGASS